MIPPTEYFDMYSPTGEKRGRFRVTHVHLIEKTVTYRPARWYERLWLWLTRKEVKSMVLNYD